MMSLSDSIQIGKRRVAIGSILSWHQYQYTDGPTHGKLAVIALLKTFPEMTSRMISDKSGIERTSLVLFLRQLEDEKAIKVMRVKPCPSTGKVVRWYGLSSRDIGNTNTLFD